jgi:hypothetical protein
MFRTLQDRLPKELKLAGIADVDAANRFLMKIYIARHNARFADSPAEAGSALVPAAEDQWRDVLAIFHGPRRLARWRCEGTEPTTEFLQRKRPPLAPPPETCGNRGKAEKAFPPFPQAQQQKAVNSCAK